MWGMLSGKASWRKRVEEQKNILGQNEKMCVGGGNTEISVLIKN